MKRTGITTHVLDTMLGVPGRNIEITLSIKLDDSDFKVLNSGKTDQDGRVQMSETIKTGVYRLRFEIGAYYSSNNVKHFFPAAEVEFMVDEAEQSHYHVPLVITPFAYSTYRGT